MTTSMLQLKDLEKSMGAIDAAGAARMIASMADVALVLDSKGIIRDVSFSSEELSSQPQNQQWIGRAWVDTVTVESRPKVERLLRDADGDSVGKSRELNHPVPGGEDLPIRYSTVQIGPDGPVVALGRDLRVVSRLQQRLMDAQRSMERDYLRLRATETRYRMLFQFSSEAILIADAATLKIVDMNPAAAVLLESTPGKLVGRTFADLFAGRDKDDLATMVQTVRGVGRVEAARLSLTDDRACFVSASLFRQDEAAHILIRVQPASPGNRQVLNSLNSQVLQAVEDLPEAFLVVGLDRMIVECNTAFLEIAQLSNHGQARGQAVDRWIGRNSLECNVLFANLREHGSVRDFATVFRSDYGAAEDVEISGVAVMNAEQPCYGLVMRNLRRRIEHQMPARADQSRSASQLSELVGRVPLKDLVRETTELTERLCIEASLTLTGDNRAAAAQMLGLSRQSLYSKLRRYGIGDLGPDDQENN